MTSVALVIEKLRASGNNIKWLIPHIITSQCHIATGTRTHSDSSFISVYYKYLSNTFSKLDMFRISSLGCTVNEILLCILSFLEPTGSYMN